jgi:hypothetical protein
MKSSEKEHIFILEWADNWCSLRDLIYDHLRTDEKKKELVVEDEVLYRNIRLWFIQHENVFKPIWRKFFMKKDWALDVDKDIIEEIRSSEKLLENPFLCWYSYIDLIDLLRLCAFDPIYNDVSESKSWASAVDLLGLDKVALDFVQFVLDRSCI